MLGTWLLRQSRPAGELQGARGGGLVEGRAVHGGPVAPPVQRLAAHVAVQADAILVQRRKERHVRRCARLGRRRPHAAAGQPENM